MDEALLHASSSLMALSISGVASVLGLWVGRDHSRAIGFGLAMTALVGGSIGAGMVQSVLDARKALDRQADLDRMIATVTDIALASGDRDLAALIEAQTGTRVEIPPDPVPATHPPAPPAQE